MLFILIFLGKAYGDILDKFPYQQDYKTIYITDDISLSGYFIQGGLVYGQAPKNTIINLHKKNIKIDSQGRFIIGFHHQEKSPILLMINNVTHKVTIKKRDYKVQRINNLKKKHVSPPQETLNRIFKEVALSKEKRMIDSNYQYSFGKFITPLEGYITGIYGSRRILNGQERQPHYGYDIAVKQGTKVTAPQSGKIIMVADLYFSGNTLIIDHGHGVMSSFLHLHKILVNENDIIQQGDIIAEVGSTGRSTGPHLDWRINWYDRRIDAATLLAIAQKNNP